MSEPGTEARTAARWWADKLRDDFELDSRDPTQSPESIGMSAIARDLARRHVNAAAVDQFEAALAVEAQRLLDDKLTSYFTALEMSTDYGPGPALGRALEAAGLAAGVTALPWKTTMWIQPGSVRVADPEIVELPLVP